MNMKINEELDRLGIVAGNGYGVFLLDFAALFPYVEQDELDLFACLSSGPANTGDVYNIHEGCVQNHRYPNTGYTCLTGKHGRKRCTFGCIVRLPYYRMNGMCYLNIGYGFQERKFTGMSIPVDLHASDTAPCMTLEIHFMLKNLDSPELFIRAYEHTSDHGFKSFLYSTVSDHDSVRRHTERYDGGRFLLLTPAEVPDDAAETGWTVYEGTVRPFPGMPDSVMI